MVSKDYQCRICRKQFFIFQMYVSRVGIICSKCFQENFSGYNLQKYKPFDSRVALEEFLEEVVHG